MARSGDDFEKFILDSWPIGSDAKPTVNSGAMHEDGDLTSRDWQIETKDGYAEGVTFRREWLNKIMRAALLRSKMPLGLHRTTEGDSFAIMKLSDFFGLIEELHEHRDGVHTHITGGED